MQKLLSIYKNYFSENRKWLRLCFIWFAISTFLGIAAYLVYPESLEEIIKVLEEKFGSDPALDFSLVLDIFLNNLLVAAVGFIGGFLFGIGPFVIVVVNGLLLGYIVTAFASINPTSALNTAYFLVAGLVPHGIIEIPAFLIAAALGLRLGLNWLSESAYGQRFKVLKNDLKSAMIIFPGIVVLLFIAALLEVYVTGNLTQ